MFAAVMVTMLAGVLPAQEPAAREFGSASGGEVRMIVKTPAATSGSLGIQLMGDDAKRFEGTFGGALVKDRVWFFASAQRSESTWLASSTAAVPESIPANEMGGNLAAGAERRMLTAAAFSAEKWYGATTESFVPRAPSSFLSLRSTANVTTNTFFTATVWRGATTGADSPPRGVWPH